ncbi:PadR family transcriptional regulator [Candidatus Micrarchaeota archaeon CG10_big_fil_rev_8_21_14_0_10_45_29]|nr:MAG: PadR family transcriptional regulator [Candidatus Micrarchaeota archaeon CG10_big_fil_rev_8_21_14_0_10_45_29]
MQKKKSKPLARLEQSITLSNLWLSILSLAKQKPIYAYALPSKIKESFGFSPSRLLTYLVLYRLEGEGLLTSKQEGQRKYYSLTSSGKASLESAKKLLYKRAKEL